MRGKHIHPYIGDDERYRDLDSSSVMCILVIDLFKALDKKVFDQLKNSFDSNG